jgi:hypothetical protein
MAMAWQRVDDPRQVQPWFLRGSPGFEIVPELAPRDDEAIFDKITMSAFEGTPLAIALRDCSLTAFAIVGVAIESALSRRSGMVPTSASFPSSFAMLVVPVMRLPASGRCKASPLWGMPSRRIARPFALFSRRIRRLSRPASSRHRRVERRCAF